MGSATSQGNLVSAGAGRKAGAPDQPPMLPDGVDHGAGHPGDHRPGSSDGLAGRSSGRLHRAARVAQQVLRCTDPWGVRPEALRLAGRAYAFELTSANQCTRQLALALLACQAAKNVPLADRRTVEAVFRTLDGIRASRPVRPRLSREREREGLPLEEARAVPIDRLFAALGFALTRRGSEYVTRCPFHDDEHPSLRMNPERGVWYCDVCGTGGDGIDFVARLRRGSFASAVREVATC